MPITSNIPDVISELKALRKGIPEAIQPALAPESWKATAMREAWLALEPLVESPHQARLAREFLRLVKLKALEGNGMEWGIELKANDILEFIAPEDDEITARSVNRQMVREWVEQEKDKDQRDKSNEEITARILAVIFRRDRTPARDRAAEALVFGNTGTHGQGILEYAMEKNPDLARVPVEKLSDWLRAILEAWTDLILDEAPVRVVAELDKLLR